MSTTGKTVKNSRTRSSAAAFSGVIGLPDPGRGPTYGDGGLYAFLPVINRACDEFLAVRETRDRRLGRECRSL